LEAGGVVVVYATDHEPHSRHQPEVAGSAEVLPVHREDQRHVEFLADADLVIHDAQYTVEEYPGKLTWGHSPAELTVDFALAAGVKRLALFHHDPLRDDAALDRLAEKCRERAVAGGLEVFAAAEGQTIELAEQEKQETIAPRAVGQPEAAIAKPVDAAPATILLVDDDMDIVRLLTLTLRPEGYRLLSAGDGNAALEIARAERPDLLLLDWNMPGRNGLEVCRALRAESDPDLRNVPVVLLTAQVGAEDTAAGFAAGVTDYVTKPFKPAHIRSRVHAWLSRKRAGPEGM
jgi:CheY-like chemotaxis protein